MISAPTWASLGIGGLLAVRWIDFLRLRVASARSRPPALRPPQPQVACLFAVYVLALVLWVAGLLGGAEMFGAESPLRIVAAMVLVIPGVWLRLTAARTLGDAFSFGGEAIADALVTQGVYRRLKHPLLLGYGLEIAGLACAGPAPDRAVLAICLVALVFLVWEARVEEQALAGRFGEDWESYAKGKLL